MEEDIYIDGRGGVGVHVLTESKPSSLMERSIL